MGVVSAAVVTKQTHAVELVGLDEELQLIASGRVRDHQRYVPRYQPERPAGNCKAVIARHAQAFLAELVEGFAPAPVAAVNGHRVDTLGIPHLFADKLPSFHFAAATFKASRFPKRIYSSAVNAMGLVWGGFSDAALVSP